MSSLKNAGALIARGLVRLMARRLAMMALLMALVLIVGTVGAIADAVGAAPPPPPGSSASRQQPAAGQDLLAYSDFYEIDKNQVLIVDAPGLLQNDTGPAHKYVNRRWDVYGGRATVASDGSFRFTPDQDFVGRAYFRYLLVDGDGASDEGLVHITVEGSDPVAVDHHYETDVDTALVVDAPGMLEGAYDPDGTDVVVLDAAWWDIVGGEVTEYSHEDGSFTFVPEPGFVGTASFSYSVMDADGEENHLARVYIEVVDPTDDLPAACDANGYCDPDPETSGDEYYCNESGCDPDSSTSGHDEARTNAPARTETPTYTG